MKSKSLPAKGRRLKETWVFSLGAASSTSSRIMLRGKGFSLRMERWRAVSLPLTASVASSFWV